MLGVLLCWGIILLLAITLGEAIYLKFFPGTYSQSSRVDIYLVVGLMLLNVYAQIYSLFSGVGKNAFLLISVITILLGLCV